MRTAYCPQSHRELANESAGKAYGHVPGHQYHDVDVVVSSRSGAFRVHVVESWGSAQGYDEEHGRREAIGRGESIKEAIASATERAAAAGIETEYLAQAISIAEDAAIEESSRPGPNAVLAAIDDADFSDCTAVGYSWALYGDGRVTAVYNSRWQGSRDGARYTTEPGFVDVDAIEPANPDRNAEAMLTMAIGDCDPADHIAFRATNRGHIVR